MHELGIVYEIVRQVEKIAKEQQLTEIASITLQIGQLSSVIPEYLEKCYPAAVDGTRMEKTELRIEVMPANAICLDCNKVYDVVLNDKKCPYCGSWQYEILSGKECFIKEILAC